MFNLRIKKKDEKAQMCDCSTNLENFLEKVKSQSVINKKKLSLTLTVYKVIVWTQTVNIYCLLDNIKKL